MQVKFNSEIRLEAIVLSFNPLTADLSTTHSPQRELFLMVDWVKVRANIFKTEIWV